MLTHEKYLEKFKAKWNDEYDLLSKYVKSDLPILVRHNVCGGKYEKPAGEALRYGCKDCAREILKKNLLGGGKVKAHEQFVHDLKAKFGDEYTMAGEYKGHKIMLRLRHKNCGKEFLTRPTDILYNNRTCTYCNQSKGAKVIEDWLLNNSIEYVKEYSFEDCIYECKLKFDFALFIKEQLLCLIEFDGEQHYKKIELFGGENYLHKAQIRDSIKNKYCRDRDIRLIRVPYFIDNIELYLKQALADIIAV